MDPALLLSDKDDANVAAVFDRLASFRPDFSIENELAVGFEPNRNATEWQIRLRPNVRWHDGKPFTADDVIYTIRRLGAPKSTAVGKSFLQRLNIPAIRKVNSLTVRIPTRVPLASLPESFALWQTSIFQDGQKDFSKPPGTGPFVIESFRPGQATLFKKNPEYWRNGLPYVDELEYVTIADPVARFNALLAGQIHAMADLPPAQALRELRAGRVRVLVSLPSSHHSMAIQTTRAPFRDVRVRQAMKMLADRKALINAVFNGLGEVGNDIYGKGQVFYNAKLPQRKHDPDEARSLLRRAGALETEFTLYTTDVQGRLQAATALAEQARQAGVKLKVNNSPSQQFYAQRYDKVPFYSSIWTGFSITQFFLFSITCSALYNETNFCRPQFERMLTKALGTVDPDKAKKLWFDMEEILWTTGGNLFWGVSPYTDALSRNVRGYGPRERRLLGKYKFYKWWLAS
jgi:peptide/nickel transport system substrate-binding protein